jgi:hypothetical protein
VEKAPQHLVALWSFMLARSLKTTTNQEIIAVNVFVNLVPGSQRSGSKLAVQADLGSYMLSYWISQVFREMD